MSDDLKAFLFVTIFLISLWVFVKRAAKAGLQELEERFSMHFPSPTWTKEEGGETISQLPFYPALFSESHSGTPLCPLFEKDESEWVFLFDSSNALNPHLESAFCYVSKISGTPIYDFHLKRSLNWFDWRRAKRTATALSELFEDSPRDWFSIYSIEDTVNSLPRELVGTLNLCRMVCEIYNENNYFVCVSLPRACWPSNFDDFVADLGSIRSALKLDT